MTTRAQVSGYRFGLARAEHALVRRDVRMIHDPMRAQTRSVAAGVIVAVLLLAAAGVYGLIRPAPSIGDARIVSDPGGGLYVDVEGVLHPVLNLASARLVVGGPEPVRGVGARALSERPRGATLGIPGAPASLPGPAHDGASTWTVCDGSDGTALLAGPTTGSAAPGEAGVLVSHGSGVWLLYSEIDGEFRAPVRARVDTTRIEVIRALGLEGRRPRPVSAALLGTFGERPALAVPVIDRRGERGPLGLPVGTVVRTTSVAGVAGYRVILPDGVQTIPATTAEMLRAVDGGNGSTVHEVSPADLARVSAVTTLDVAHHPASAPAIAAGEVLCRTWSRDRGERRARETMFVGDRLPLPPQARPVPLGSRDGVGPALDAVFVAAGTLEHLAVTGSAADSPLAGQQFVVTDGGVRHRIVGADAAAALGLGDDPPRAPWSVIGLLPTGPELSRAGALVARDAVAEPGDGDMRVRSRGASGR